MSKEGANLGEDSKLVPTNEVHFLRTSTSKGSSTTSRTSESAFQIRLTATASYTVCSSGDETSCPSSIANTCSSISCTNTNGYGYYQCLSSDGSVNCIGSICPSGLCDSTCSAYATCFSCTQTGVCGWCPSTGLCLTGNANQATSSYGTTCTTGNYDWYKTINQCPMVRNFLHKMILIRIVINRFIISVCIKAYYYLCRYSFSRI